MKYLIAVDPGATGAIAFRDPNGNVAVDSMPETLRDIWEYFASTKEYLYIGAIIEDAGYHVQGNNASASAKFARHCGTLEMALTASGLPWESVRPQKWMKMFGPLPNDKNATLRRKKRKARIKELMQRLYPNIKVTLQNADALAILTWAIKQENGQ